MGIIVIDLAEGRSHRAAMRKKRRNRDSEAGINYSTAPVIAVDPGGTTGWSFMCVEPLALHDPQEMVLENIITHQHGELSSTVGCNVAEGEDLCVADLYEFISAWPQAAVVVEDFVIRSNNRSREFLSPVRITAALKHLLWADNRYIIRQTPADAKITASDDRLKSWGLYDKHGSLGHARDADRHAITFLRKAKSNPKLRAMAWPHLFGEEGIYAVEDDGQSWG
ncbi:RuvC-like resolvase [Mycobacterium phage Thoth]|uniref:RuvC-like resolvase n=10 Tax=Plotvirus TaxID=2169613 RepID=A0A5P8DAG3_9CAUD|nr:hypothetical protein Adjutor_68 [Mycobacterium phage Adjutor]ACI06356.1 hypothetical protein BUTTERSCOTCH_68 [Mycobacterium phage Butterscotch]AVP43166.1 resolvase [Mycobacterium phage BigMama]AXC38560.1 RuvC-like resolvase [Mycobacterium phage Visconti]QBJ04785.1 RuvC-like resolvase [Mycobacterium phage Delton]QEA11443.1 RuvC-like resolvase [Mycobacterium phage Penelope2018]QFG14219.1 RuvC-like resolvase [Mycobacterium phage Giuseppe]QFP95995.1 RuvC-like resolvase [Mycobacterium phage He